LFPGRCFSGFFGGNAGRKSPADNQSARTLRASRRFIFRQEAFVEFFERYLALALRSRKAA
jgi:hypothetical protein